MAKVRKVLRLPQTYGLTGRNTRTALDKLYGERFGPAASLVDMARRSVEPKQIEDIPSDDLASIAEEISRYGGMGDASQFDPSLPSGSPAFSGKTGQEVTNSILGPLARRPVSGTVMTGVSAAAAGVPGGVIADYLPEIIARRAIGGLMSPLGLPNYAAGGYAAGVLGEEAGSEIAGQGYRLNEEEIDETSAAGVRGARSSAGLVGMGLRGAGSLLTRGVMSPRQLASESASQTAAGITATKTPFVPMPKAGEIDPLTGLTAPDGPTYTPGGSVGPPGTPGQSGMAAQPFGPLPNVTDSGGSSASGGGGAYSPGGGMGPVGTPGQAGMDAGPSTGGAGGTVICSELHRQGLMPDNIYEADAAFGDSLDDDTMNGYHLWGEPVARLMARSKTFTKLIRPVVMSWAKAMARRQGVVCGRSLFGMFVLQIGVPVCKLLGMTFKQKTVQAGN